MSTVLFSKKNFFFGALLQQTKRSQKKKHKVNIQIFYSFSDCTDSFLKCVFFLFEIQKATFHKHVEERNTT